MTDSYVTAPELADALPTNNLSDATLIDLAITGASRGVDAYCGTQFGTPAATSIRHYYPPGGQVMTVHPIADTTGLVVKTDPAGDGSWSTTWTMTTDYLLLPLDAASEIPARPYTQIWLPTLTFPAATGRPTVQVTALFGWPTVPADVRAATLLLARDLFKELKDAPFGVAGTAEFGVLRIRANNTAQMLLGRYRRPMVA